MEKEIQDILKKAIKEISQAKSEEDLQNTQKKYLGRKGELTLLLRNVSSLQEKERAEAGKAANIAKKDFEAKVADRYFSLESKGGDDILKDEWMDVTLPAKPTLRGKRHPLHATIEEIEDVFGRMGFEVAEGPEIEDDWHNFTALNIPEDHPAREMQDTFWLEERMKGYVLRTQTSGIQIRYYETRKPPIRIIAPGKVFRKDSDATHSPMFHQYEGFLIDRNVSLAHLKFILANALRQLIAPDAEIRFRLSFFPFTEPSLEVDALLNIDGKKRWLEIAGAGMVHPNVLKNGGLDPKEWNGFAFGLGIERQIMIKHGISDLRLFYENDLRFLEQF
ncbi:phenylalanine--tRNA ligase subunit alpha [Candidatus Peregrinibacteria bacterium]|nr:phenylalanine--tRNA ligase subunit alpha [Candidatus Peregrinibacteria bacterium]